jgi:hypothetical protein
MYFNSIGPTQVLTTSSTNELKGVALNTSIVPVTDSNGNITSSSTTSTKLSYLNNVTSDIQTQLNGKQALSSGLTSGDYIKATGTGTIGNATVLSESGSNLYVAGSLNLTPAADGIIVTINNHSGSDIFQINSTTGLVSSLINFLVGGSYGTSSTTSFQVSTHGNVPVFTVDNSTPQINIGTNIYPSNTNTNNLGNSTNTWAGVAANNIVAENGTVYNYCQSLTLGLINSNYGIYTTMTAGTANYYFCFASGTGWFTNASILPSSDGYSALGASGQAFSTLWTHNANVGSLNASTVLVADSSKNIISSGVSSTTLGYLDATSSIQTQLNSKQSTLSGLTSGKHLVANGSNSITTSSILGETGGNLQIGSNITFTSNTFNSGTTFLCPSTTYSGSFYAPSALNNVFVGNNGTNNYFNVNGGTGASILQLLQSSSITNKALLITGTGSGSGSPSSTTAGVYASLNYNASGNRQLIFGDTDYTSTSGGALRFAFFSGQPNIDNCVPDGSAAGGTRNIGIGSNLIPSSTATYTLGSSSGLWGSVWASNGTIQTSDVNQKTNVVASTLGLNFINQLQPKQWNWNNSLDNDIHFGLVYQDVDALDTNNNFGFLHQSDGSATGTHGMVYTELIGPMIAAIQSLSAQVTALQTQVTALTTT